ncbi:MAG TPA: MoaD/ThiS family protein [Planctomycetota bacterium]|nr:MoaD/ThiS family protein [Planctomycetota bacterium]
MRVQVSSVLHSYTGGCSQVEAAGATILDVLADLDRQFPGLRFRVLDEQGRLRPHMRVFVGVEQEKNLQAPVREQEIHLLHALSGG